METLLLSQKNYTETEERIFKAALEIFSKKGKDGARMQEIADLAGINKAMLHYYYRSKQRLYEAVFEYVFYSFMMGLSKTMNEAETFEEALRLLITYYIDKNAQRPAIMRLMVQENLAGASAIARRMEEVGEVVRAHAPYQVFSKKMQAAIEAGEIRSVDPFQTFVTILGACVFFFLAFPAFSQLRPELADQKDALIEARKEHLFDLIYHGLKPRN